jgi:glycosyltransferase involved in cell wall biosynthesis
MISVCIPVFNCNITGLVDKLSEQGEKSCIPYEIILIDDRSSERFRLSNEKAFRDHNCIMLEENIGRSKIRNLFLNYANYDKLLFLDCDSEIISNEFLANYIKEAMPDYSGVIYGGLVNDKTEPPGERRLRWKYGISREGGIASIRERSPYRHFRANNFLVDRKILEVIKFEERIVEYGHEDTLFAYRLMKGGITVKHIDNPVLHCCRESNMEFLDKSKNGVANLVAIMKYTDHDREFINGVRLLRTYLKIRQWRLQSFLGLLSGITQPGLKILLARGLGGLWMLDLYKLGILLQTGTVKKNGRQ